MSYRLDADLNLVGSGNRKLLNRKQDVSKKEMFDALEAVYQGSGKTRGGFLQWLTAPIRMIQNAVEGNAWDYGINKGIKSKKEEQEAMKGKGKTDKPKKAKRKVSEYHKVLGKLMKQGMSMKDAQALLKKKLKK